MKSNHRGSNTFVRLVGGLIIIIGAVIAFSIFQERPTIISSPPTPTAIPQTVQATSVEITSLPTEPQATSIPFSILPTLPQTTSFAPTSEPSTTTIPAQNLLKISIAKMHVLTPVIELYFAQNGEWDLTYLNQAVGHLQGTAPMGKKGNFVLAGHVELKDGTEGPFAHLISLTPGDLITILDGNSSNTFIRQYKVKTVSIVKPDAMNEILYHGYEELTLVTCDAWNQQKKAYQERVIVHALPVKG